MPRSRQPLLYTVAAAGIAFGYALGYRTTSHGDIAAPSVISPATAPVPVSTTPASATAHPPAAPQTASDDSSGSLAALRSPSAETQACMELQREAATNPLHALALADQASTPRQRALLRDAALRGWASVSPADALAWTLEHVHPPARIDSIQAVAQGSVSRPDEAIAVFQRLVADDPASANTHGSALAVALARDGQFAAACRFAATGPGAARGAWLSSVYQTWAAYDPQAALQSLPSLPDDSARTQARTSLYVGWSNSDPASLVTYATSLPAGAERLDALTDGLTQWVYRDPVAASAWMNTLDPSPDLDAGAAAVATSPVLVARKPEVATSWAESITDPELRANTLLDLIRLWAATDPASARLYATTAPTLAPETRAAALSTLDAPQ